MPPEFAPPGRDAFAWAVLSEALTAMLLFVIPVGLAAVRQGIADAEGRRLRVSGQTA